MIEPQIPKAIARSRPRKLELRIDCVAGRIAAPPSPYQGLTARGKAGQNRGKQEEPKPGQIHLAPPKPIAQPPHRHQEGGEDKGIDGVDPLGARARKGEVARDGGDRNVHDRRVDDDHGHAEAEHRQAEPATPRRSS
jgi:hypothetical protein